MGEKGVQIIRKKPRIDRQLSVAGRISHQNFGDDEANAESRGDCRRRFVEQTHEAATDDAATGKRDADGAARVRRRRLER
jgi:hypothetical protein